VTVLIAAVVIGIGAIFLYLCAVLLYDASGQRTLTLAERYSENVQVMQWITLSHLPVGHMDGQVRIEPKSGGVIEVYVERRDFEAIPYPDRREFIEAVGKFWCDSKPRAKELWPTLSFFDIRSGERFGKYACRLHQVSIPYLMGPTLQCESSSR